MLQSVNEVYVKKMQSLCFKPGEQNDKGIFSVSDAPCEPMSLTSHFFKCAYATHRHSNPSSMQCVCYVSLVGINGLPPTRISFLGVCLSH